MALNLWTFNLVYGLQFLDLELDVWSPVSGSATCLVFSNFRICNLVCGPQLLDLQLGFVVSKFFSISSLTNYPQILHYTALKLGFLLPVTKSLNLQFGFLAPVIIFPPWVTVLSHWISSLASTGLQPAELHCWLGLTFATSEFQDGLLLSVSRHDLITAQQPEQ